MKKVFGALLIVMFVVFTAAAQSADDLKAYFEGKQVKLRIDMPDSKEGVDVFPERSQSLNYDQYAKRLGNGIAIQRGEVTRVSKLKVKENNIEFHLTAINGRDTRFNVQFARIESWMLTPATLIDALRKYVEFSDVEIARSYGPSRYPKSFIRHGVVQLGPRGTYLKAGLSTEEVLRLLGEPSSVSERLQEGTPVSVYEFQRAEGRVIVAEFVAGALVNSRTETISARATLPYRQPDNQQ